jgi:hypothetical protein
VHFIPRSKATSRSGFALVVLAEQVLHITKDAQLKRALADAPAASLQELVQALVVPGPIKTGVPKERNTTEHMQYDMPLRNQHVGEVLGQRQEPFVSPPTCLKISRSDVDSAVLEDFKHRSKGLGCSQQFVPPPANTLLWMRSSYMRNKNTPQESAPLKLNLRSELSPTIFRVMSDTRVKTSRGCSSARFLYHLCSLLLNTTRRTCRASSKVPNPPHTLDARNTQRVCLQKTFKTPK